MSIKIEFHLLQSFPPANLNRDDTNTPKDCEFGGVRRARISSQCCKRAIRLHPDFAEVTGVEPAERTRLLAGKIKEALLEIGKTEEEAEKVSNGFVGVLLGGMNKKKAYQSLVLYYVSAEEKKDIAKRLVDDWEKALQGNFDEIKKEYIKKFTNRSSAPDIALFGRMLAEDPSLSLDAACQMAHAISTHKVNMEMDFYTAVDDLLKEGDSGAGMMGVTGFNSATFYRYAAIDWEQLVKNLDGNLDLARKTVKGFLRAIVKAIPTGKQNSFAAQTPPAFILTVVRDDGQAWSLVNAFEKPVSANRKEGGFLEASIKALLKHWQRMIKVYGDPDKLVKAYALVLDENVTIEPLKSEDTLTDLEKKTLVALSAAK